MSDRTRDLVEYWRKDSTAENSDESAGALTDDDYNNNSVAHSSLSSSKANTSGVGKQAEVDTRSIYVGNVEYSATAYDLERLFQSCGAVNRVTIPCHRLTTDSKGYAYVEFADKESVRLALSLDTTVFRGRLIRVCAKRTNVPGMRTQYRRYVSPLGYTRRSWMGMDGQIERKTVSPMERQFRKWGWFSPY